MSSSRDHDEGEVGSDALGSSSAKGVKGPTIAWFHCFAGIAGDMALGSLLDAGADLEDVRDLLGRLPLRRWDLRAEPVLRNGIAATRAIVDPPDDVVVRTHAHIVGLIQEARLPERVAHRSLAAFGALAQVEARLHRRRPENVHFHEVGSGDAIIDIVGTASALEVLDIDEVTASSVATGTGTVRTAHGFVPNPSPAVVELLRGAPTWGRDVSIELTTPTGAAILAATATGFGPMPRLRIQSSGFGAGRAEIDDLPNCTQVVVGERELSGSGPGQPAVLIETNVDDVTGEVLAHALEAVLRAGAHDAWISSVLMKKGRPGHVVSVLCDPSSVDSIARVLADETGTFGVRWSHLERRPAKRETDQVEVEGLSVRMKVGTGRAKPEQRDAARVAERSGLPLREVLARAEAAWREGPQGDFDDPPPSA
ncbi:MAG TPA: nickel pincer cofactor biosynthesis protein LarC [Acidimicrobiales bacterium]|nr:nickel pincer cofactor biosynthesis protein LarC [Acidimicrobiales bacterium]